MIYFFNTMVLLYYLVFIVYYQSLFPVQGHRIPQILLTLTLVYASYVGLNAQNLLVLNFPAIMAIMIVGFRFSTGMNWSQATYGGGISTITAYCFRGMFTAMSALIYKGDDLLYNANAYYIITLFALPAALLFLEALRKTILPDNKLKQFLSNPGQVKLVIVYQMAAVINLVLINAGRALAPHVAWYMCVALGACILTFFMLLYAIYQSIRSTELLEYQWRAKELEDQYKRQLQHYKSYQKYTESFRTFRHDYKYMMGALKSLIRANDNEKALLLLDNIYDDMQKKVQIHKKYSDNITLDAVLQDLANTCAEKEIRFSCNVVIPRNTNLSFLDKIRIFSNICYNAVEACEKVPIPARFIEIISKNDKQWATLEVTNSYDGKAVVKDGHLVTTKSQKHDHGMGLGIVQKIAEQMGGFVIYDMDAKSGVFLMRVHIPYSQNQAS